MSRKAEIFFDAITLLREDLVEEAQNCVFRRKRGVWRKFGSLAACVALVASLGLLAVMPRGCGASSGNSAAPMEPAASPGDANMDSAYGGGWDGAQAEPNPAPSTEMPPAAEEPLRFTAQVLEVLEDGLLVKPFDSALADMEVVRIPTAGLENLPAFYPGGVVAVSCGEIAREDGEAVALDVAELWLTEPEGP